MLLILLLVFVILISLKWSKYKINPITVFVGMWTVIIFLNSLKLYNMYEFGNKAIWIIGVGLFGFMVGGLCYHRFKSFKNTKSEIIGASQYKGKLVPTTLMYVVLIISMIFNVWMSITVLRLMSQYNLEYGYVRSLLLESDAGESMFQSSFLRMFYNWVDVPIVYALTPITLIMLIEGKFSKLFVGLNFINIAIFTFATSGRLLLLSIVIQLIALVEWYKLKISKKKIKRIMKYIVVISLCMIFITFARIKETTNTEVNTFYAYFSIPVSLLEYWTKQVDTAGIHTNGICFFYGIFIIGNWFLGKFGITMPWLSDAITYINITQESWVKVFPNKWYNAFVSIFYYFYVDFRYIGVFIGCLCFGLICSNVYVKAYTSNSRRELCFWLLMLQCIVSSMIRWQLGNASFILSIIVLMVLVPKRRMKVR